MGIDTLSAEQIAGVIQEGDVAPSVGEERAVGVLGLPVAHRENSPWCQGDVLEGVGTAQVVGSLEDRAPVVAKRSTWKYLVLRSVSIYLKYAWMAFSEGSIYCKNEWEVGLPLFTYSFINNIGNKLIQHFCKALDFPRDN